MCVGWLCSIFNEVLIFEVANPLNARLGNINLTLVVLDYSILICTHLKLCLATATHNFKWVK